VPFARRHFGDDLLGQNIERLFQYGKLIELAATDTPLRRLATPADIADIMQEWFEAGACDGFNVTPATLPGGGEDFVDMVVPELQRRGLFRREYEGATLREHLRLPRPSNRFFQN
jgi:alkanesulfonate monooxygenase SsuD/methylene tetrahydromethanopterin reductase-like flavin-dependent oxidoreductase (luciferase family)